MPVSTTDATITPTPISMPTGITLVAEMGCVRKPGANATSEDESEIDDQHEHRQRPGQGVPLLDQLVIFRIASGSCSRTIQTWIAPFRSAWHVESGRRRRLQNTFGLLRSLDHYRFLVWARHVTQRRSTAACVHAYRRQSLSRHRGGRAVSPATVRICAFIPEASLT